MGNFQKLEDYGKKLSPVIDFTAVRIGLAISQLEGAYVHHVDISNAFVYADLTEETYMSLFPKSRVQRRASCAG